MEIDNKKVLISAIIVALVVLVSFNFEKMTGQTTATSNSRDIQIIGSTTAGSTVTVKITPKTGTINVGGSGDEERLWFKGPGIKRNLELDCVRWQPGAGSDKCKEAQIEGFWIPSDAAGTYYFTVEQTTKTGRKILAQKEVTI